ncbi:MAG: hypothetical protein PHP23_02540 [Desulfobacterales bacterium]|nr:hypothetical protein [Desulfobacterales bacterium]MDD4071131.1 hypothetical protein [Desulfobacterales bacterium]MDD4393526.1 hypothetical protein [Desulfobacterales bacterium]
MNLLEDQIRSISESLSAVSREIENLSNVIKEIHIAPLTAESETALSDVLSVIQQSKDLGDRAKKTKNGKELKVTDSVYDVIKRSKKGASIAKLREKTLFDPRQISNALYKLTKNGKIIAKSRGLYIKV